MNVYVSARKLSMPPACPCCDGDPDSELTVSYTRTTGKRVIREQTRGWTFPYCHRCVAHATLWNAATTIAGATIVVGLLAGIVVGVASAGMVGVAVFVVSLPIALVLASRQKDKARAACVPSCASAGPSVAYLGWDGSVQGFEFISQVYSTRFARSNARSLTNVSADLRRLLDSTPAQAEVRITASISKSTAAVAPTGPAPSASTIARAGNDSVIDWIARIESYKGPVARRNALMKALGEISDPEARRSLVLAASKIEVAAVLDKVDTLATPAAKRRHLEKAISELRADDIPDDLQAEELAMLDAALRSLGPE